MDLINIKRLRGLATNTKYRITQTPNAKALQGHACTNAFSLQMRVAIGCARLMIRSDRAMADTHPQGLTPMTGNRIFEVARQHPWQLAMLALAVSTAAVAGVWWLRGPQIPVIQVHRRDLVQTVVASGHVEAPHRMELGTQVTGTVVRVPVSEGQSVKAGELLVELDSAELQAAQRQADIALQQAQDRLRQLQSVQVPVAEQTVRQARATLENTRVTLRRNEDLFRQGFVGAAALDDSRKAVELADAQMRSNQMQLDSLSPGGSDHALAVEAVAQARAGLQAARARSGYAQIRAPVAGSLIARNVEVGDVVQPGKVLLTLSPDGKTQLVVQIDEKNLRLLALGQTAIASADAYPQLRFAAQLVYINPGINAQTGAVEVKLDVPQPPAVLRQDLTVSVDIEVARRPQTLVIASAAVHDADSANPWVLRVENGHAVRRTVHLGLTTAGWSELLNGVNEGDPIVDAGSSVAAGARVRPTTQSQ
jgi:HlyD family secretion protein